MPEFTPEDFAAVCAAIGLDPQSTLSINASPTLLRVVHTDQAVTLRHAPPPAEPEPAADPIDE